MQNRYSTASSLTLVLLTLLVLCGQPSPSHASEALVRTIHAEAIGQPDALNDSARPSASTELHLTFALPTKPSSEIDQFLKSLTDPKSPNYHKWIKPQEFGEKFGGSDADIAAVESYLASNGLTKIKLWPDKSFISVDVPRSQAESLFGVTIHGYNRPASQVALGLSPTYYAPDRDPAVPQVLSAHLTGILGLSDIGESIPSVHLASPDAEHADYSGGPLTAASLAQVYNVSALHNAGWNGQGETIAIFSPTAFQQSDINTFLSANGLSSSQVSIVNVDGGNSSLSYQLEACADIEILLGQAPAATIKVYECPAADITQAYLQMESDDPNIVTSSWPLEEYSYSSQADSYLETIRQAMTAEGITLFACTGDYGAYISPAYNIVGVSAAASSAYVTAVGGTELSVSGNGSWNSEVAWTYNDGTTGTNEGSNGGLSTDISEPSWQTGPGVANSYSNGMRQLPDVSALASTPFYTIYENGGYQTVGGTSCSTPFWAACISLVAESLGGRLGNIDPTLYDIGTNYPSVFHDITSGNNGIYSCTTGWDFVTGWGSADFGALQQAFQQIDGPSVTAPTISPNGGTYSSAQTVTLADTQSGTTIYYTTDGSTPTSSSTQYTSPITVSSSKTINAIAVASGGSSSSVTSATFTIATALPTPTISPSGGTYSTSQSVSFSDTQSGVSFYYTTNGTTPTTSSTLYTGPFTVSSSKNIEVIAVASGYANSSTASASYSIDPVLPTPSISPAGGTYTSNQSVTISDSQSGVTLYYTTNGSTPTTSSTVYTGPITVASSETVEAIAVESNYTNSQVASASFTINPVLPTPTISPNGGNYTTSQSVTIADSQSGVSLYYTTNGTTPTASSTQYTGAFTVASSETVQAVAIATGYTNSTVASAAFTISPVIPTPSITPNGGTYTTSQSVSLSDTQSGVSLYYTTNGATPTTSSTLYTGAFTVASTETVKVIAVASGYTNSSTASATFTILPVIPTPTISPNGGTYTTGQSVTISDTQGGVTIYYTTNGTTPTLSSTQYTGAFTVSNSETVQAIAVESGYTNSLVASATFAIDPIIPTPSISPSGGAFTTSQSVTIADSQSGVTIYYTTNGTTPTTSSAQYTGAFTVASSETVEAIAIESGYTNSAVASAAFTISPVIPTPSISPNGGTFTTGQTVTISDTQPGVTIYYTTNGATPTASSSQYSGSISVSSSETLKAIAVESGYTNSAVDSVSFTINPIIPAPSIAPNGGTFSASQSVTLSDTQSGVSIYYTTNGTTPTTSSTQYIVPFTVSSSETVEAIAAASGYTNSPAASAVFTIYPVIPTPTISPNGGSFTTNQTVTISDTQSGVTIYYTTNGTTPTTSSTQYTGSITVSSSETINAIAVESGYTNSATASAAFTISPVIPTPSISPNGGIFTTNQSVTLSDSQSGVTIYYTTNGSTPTSSSTVYSGPITVSGSETIKAIAVETNYTNSAVSSATFTISPVIPTPTISPSGGSYTTNQSVTITDSQSGVTIYYTTNGSTPTTSSSIYSTGITVSSSETIEAIAVASGYTNSNVASAAFTINPVIPTPIISPNGGLFTTPQTVSLSDSQSGVTIYYTTNGTTPTTGSTQYAGTFSVNSSETVEAIAVESGYTNSSVASTTFTISPVLPTPTISPVAATYTSGQTATISDSQSGVSIYYTTNGSTPTTSSTLYTGSFNVSSTETVRAIAVETGYTNSSVASDTITIALTLPQPTISPNGGLYTTGQTVSLSDSQSGTTIYYTTNGTTPTTSSTKYTGAFAVSSSETVTAIAVESTYTNSAAASAQFTIDPVLPTPSISPNGGAYTANQSVTISDSQSGVSIYYTTNGTTPTASSTLYTGPFTVSSNETVTAIAIETNYTNSSTASAAFTISPVLPTPSISPNGGNYTVAQTVTLSDTQVGVSIYYTTNGSTPTTSSTLYTGPFTVSTSSTVEAIAVQTGYTNSGTATATFTISPVLPTPSISPFGGTYTQAQSVTLSDSQSGVVIYYTINGTTPTTSSTRYTGPFAVSASETVSAIATASGYTNSAVNSAAFTINPILPTPTITPNSGTYTTNQTVTISDSQSGTTIYYTTNGSAPTTNSSVYTGSFTVTGTETVSAIAVETNYTNSAIGSANFVITPILPTPIISPNGGGYTTNQTVTITDANLGTALYYTLDGSTPTTSSTLYSGPITVSSSETVKSIAAESGYANSATASATFTITPILPAPSISPNAGTFTTAQTVTLTDSQSGATIYYTTNGTTPTTSSPVYTAPFNISSTATIEAIAVETGYTTSSATSAVITIDPIIPAPTITPAGGFSTTTETVTISDVQSGVTIYYTTNGSTPTVNSTRYTAPFLVSTSETVEAIAVASGYTTSSSTSATFTISPVLPTPSFSPNGGTYTTNQSVTISDSQSGVTIYYTTDGSVPTSSSSQYTAPITVSSSETLSAIAVKTGYTNSGDASATFSINPVIAPPTFSPGGGSFTTSQTVTIADSLVGSTIYYTTNGTAPTTSSTLYSGPITVSSTEQVEAIAVKTGYTTSAVALAQFTISPILPAPTFSPNGGVFTTSQTLTMSDTQSGATIYYTTNGSTPTTGSYKYTSPITVASSETVNAIAVESGFTNSAVTTVSFTITPTVPTPLISPTNGTFTSSENVTITDSLNNATIYYTTDGSTPTTSSTQYTGPITISSSETISAIAVAQGYTNSAVAWVSYTYAQTISYSAGLQLISLPTTDSRNLDTIFGYSGVALATWVPSIDNYAVTPTAPANQIQVGVGYWVRFPQPVTVTLAGTPAPTNAPFIISLQQGWNMIGDPFMSSVPLANVMFDNGTLTFAQAGGSSNLISPMVFNYDIGSGNYDTATSLVPGQGYWVYALQATDMDIPAPNSSQSADIKSGSRPAVEIIGADSIHVKISVRDRSN